MPGKIVLASASPRRSELLKKIGINGFVILPTDIDETPQNGITPGETAKILSEKKAASAAALSAVDDIIIAADTIVVCDEKILGKPANDNDAFEMLKMLSGRSHEVITGLCVRSGDRVIAHSEHTKVTFRKLSEREIIGYIKKGEGKDKAGAYGVQGFGAMLVSRIDGDYYNVVGLPLCSLAIILKSFGVELL